LWDFEIEWVPTIVDAFSWDNQISKKGYRVFEPSTGEFFLSKDVVIYEDKFPFHEDESSVENFEMTTIFH